MLGMDGWDILIITVGGYIAITALLRLMNRRRDALVDDLSRRAQLEQQRQRAQERKKQRKEERRRVRRQLRGEQSEDAA